jgi:hypothetical protein
MELFIPSVLILLLAAAVIFFVLPRFGAPVLAMISVGLLVYGLYEHMNAFQSEYRLSTWQAGLISYAPYVMVGGLLVVIAFYLISISPFGKPSTTAPNMPEVPTIAEMPKAETATNMVTAGVNNALKGAKNALGNAAAAVGLGNAAKNANNKGNEGTNGTTGLANKMKNMFSSMTGNNNNNNNNTNRGNNNNTNNRPRIPGINFPLSQV